MKVLIQCKICHQRFWVQGTSPRPDEFCVDNNEDFSECCEHLQNMGGSDENYELLDYKTVRFSF